MAAIPAWRASLYAPPAWCTICAIFRTKRERRIWKSRASRFLRRFPQGVKAGRISRNLGSCRHGLDVTDLLLGAAAIQKKERMTGRRIIAPHFRGAVLAHKGGRAQQGA